MSTADINRPAGWRTWTYTNATPRSGNSRDKMTAADRQVRNGTLPASAVSASLTGEVVVGVVGLGADRTDEIDGYPVGDRLTGQIRRLVMGHRLLLRPGSGKRHSLLAGVTVTRAWCWPHRAHDPCTRSTRREHTRQSPSGSNRRLRR